MKFVEKKFTKLKLNIIEQNIIFVLIIVAKFIGIIMFMRIEFVKFVVSLSMFAKNYLKGFVQLNVKVNGNLHRLVI